MSGPAAKIGALVAVTGTGGASSAFPGSGT